MFAKLNEFFSGKKTYMAAIGFFGLAFHQAVNEGNMQAALQSALLGLSALGLRAAVSKGE